MIRNAIKIVKKCHDIKLVTKKDTGKSDWQFYWARHWLCIPLRCMHCDEMVNVMDPKDNRYRFCSPRCERLYWKHPEKGKATFSRIFYCQYCGKKVVTNDPKDRRRFYCSKECRLASHQMQRTMTRLKEKLYREKTVVKERGDL